MAGAVAKYRAGGGEASIAFRPWVDGAAAGGWSGAASGPGGTDFVAYRYEAPDSAERRLRHEGHEGEEVLLAVFGEDGRELASNVGESVAREGFAFPFVAGRTYWIVAGSIDRAPVPRAAIVRME
jgi:hypothetical protein